MPRRVVPGGRLRRRLTVSFVLVAALSAGALGLGSYLLVSEARLDDSLARAEREARANLLLPPARDIPVRGGPARLRELAATYQAERGTPTVLVVGGEAHPSNPALRFAPPPELAALVRRGELAFRRMEVGGERFLVIGAAAPDPDTRAEFYFLFSEERIADDLGALRTVLLAAFGAVVLLAGAAGWAVAGRTLRPVALAGRAARSVAEGLLDTRLPVGTGDEFGAWAASFNEMAQALESKIRALTEAQARERRFTSDVAHELRTPLTALVTEASLLREHLDAMPADARRPAEMLIADVGRLRGLVEDLMEISRLDAARATVRTEPVDLRSLAEATIRARGWDGRVAVAGNPEVIATDRRRAERIVGNLVGNALEHGGRSVAVRVGRDGTGAFVEVSDRGRGIPPEHLGHLFDRFYKADPARSGPGSGLGLAIALENARLLGGDIEVWSEPGEGTRFTLRLPVAERLRTGEVPVAGEPHDAV